MNAALTVALTFGHGAVTFPPPRNRVDGDLKPWSAGVPNPVPFQPWCPFPSASEAGKDPRNLTGANGQACFWFSNGCAIGCEKCDGNTRGPVPRFGSDGTPAINYTDSSLCQKMGLPDTCYPGEPMPVCGAAHKATNCDPATRTVNIDAKCGGPSDFYYYSPWRAPGSAPVLDPCGTAGGRIKGQGHGNFGAAYVDTVHAKAGDLGSGLPAQPAGATWTAGTTVEVAWASQANHAGGYSYRLCPATEPLTEACFQKHPLGFVGQQTFRWGGVGGTEFSFNATYVTEGTTPSGSMWAMNPIPRSSTGFDTQCGKQHRPRCPQNDSARPCAGGSETGLGGLEIVDRVLLPDTLAPGAWVLGWRWDCEESNQIWSSCSDVAIVKARDAVALPSSNERRL